MTSQFHVISRSPCLPPKLYLEHQHQIECSVRGALLACWLLCWLLANALLAKGTANGTAKMLAWLLWSAALLWKLKLCDSIA